MVNDTNDAALPLPDGRFSGREAFESGIRAALARAADAGWREIIVADATFEDWPLQEREVVETLQAWSSAGRRFTMLAARYDIVTSHFARFVSWRRHWGHIVEARVCRQVDAANFPSIFWSPAWVMRRLDPVRCSGVCGTDPNRRVQTRELLDELQLGSAPGFPATTLGL